MTEVVTKLNYPERYTELQDYKKRIYLAANMIEDKEPSFRAAFIFSDAQFSDHSTMMQQYLPMDKPLLWMNNLSSALTGEEFISTKWMERGNTCADILSFLERIREGTDLNHMLRKEILKHDLPLTDGSCGERVSKALWEALHKEDSIITKFMEE